jgi:hypothetical protein
MTEFENLQASLKAIGAEHSVEDSHLAQDFPQLRDRYVLQSTAKIAALNVGGTKMLFAQDPLLYTDDSVRRPADMPGQFLAVVMADGSLRFPERAKTSGLTEDPATVRRVRAEAMCRAYGVRVALKIQDGGWQMIRHTPPESEVPYLRVGGLSHAWDTREEVWEYWADNEALLREELGIPETIPWVDPNQSRDPDATPAI